MMVIVTELLTGVTLRKYLVNMRPNRLDTNVAIGFALDIARAMGCLHSHRIIHRNLKPENLLLIADHKSVKLADFGLAREESLTEMMTAETGTYRCRGFDRFIEQRRFFAAGRDCFVTEVITAAEFHSLPCHMLAYSSSKGSIRLLDLRQSALCDNHTKLLEDDVAPCSRSFFTNIIGSISDIKLAQARRHILSRDYMTLKLWDINMDSGPVATFQVHEYLRSKLCDMYENDSIFDKFDCCLSGDGQQAATGSYRSDLQS